MNKLLFLPPMAGPRKRPTPQERERMAIASAWLVSSEISYRIVLAVPTVPVKENCKLTFFDLTQLMLESQHDVLYFKPNHNATDGQK